MNDLISREAAIAAMAEAYEDTDAEHILRKIPSAQQWIPVSERLPDEDGQYYVTVAFLGDENQVSLYTEVTSFSAKEKEFCDAGVNNYGWDYVTAWMPLQWPEPYEEETNE